jgi:N-acetylneuraminic acid mutarotase
MVFALDREQNRSRRFVRSKEETVASHERRISPGRAFLVLTMVSALALVGSGARATVGPHWLKVAPIHHYRWYFPAVTGSDGKIYAIGGCFSGSCGPPDFLASVEVYDPATNLWADLPTGLPSGRGYLAGAADGGGHIYVLGGQGNPGASTEPFVYTIATGIWTQLPSMPSSNSDMGAAVGPDGRVYAIGGWGAARLVQVYDPSSHAWSEAAPLPTPVQDPMVVTLGSRLYVIGGYNARHTKDDGYLRALFAYDPSTDSWQRRHRTRLPRVWGGAAAGADGRIYVVGGLVPDGGGGAVPTRNVTAYDPSTDSWSKTTLLPRRPFFQAVASDGAGNVYNIGGLETRHVYELTVTP